MKFLKVVIVVALSVISITAKAQENKFKSAYLYQFGRIMEWPDIGDEFVIGIWGDSDIQPIIEKISQIKKIQDKKIVVKKISKIDQLGDCEIIFLPLNGSAQIASIIESINNKGILLVAEKENMVKSGAGVSFIKSNDKILFEIHRKNIANAGLKSSLSLERIAYKVY